MITEKSLSDVDFLIENIKNIISKFDSNKADGGDMISIRMLELCDKFISKPPNIIFKSSLAQGMFSLQWKKADVVAIHKTKMTSSHLKTTYLSLFSQSVAKISNVLFTTLSSHILQKTT